MIRERVRNGMPGLPMVAVVLALIAAAVWLFVTFARNADVGEFHPLVLIASFVLFIVAIFVIRGFFLISPNEAKVLQLFGDYAGTAKDPGLRWANPFLTRKKLSLRVRNFEGSKLKVNDADGNPIEIAAVVVWRVVETAEAMFEVDDYQNYVRVQSEAALRNAATSYPYDAHEEHVVSLRGNTAVVAEHLQKEVQQRLQKA